MPLTQFPEPTTTVQATGSDKIWSYEDTAIERVDDLNLAGGLNNVDFTAVPANKVQIITVVNIRYIGTVPTEIGIAIHSGGTDHWVMVQKSPVSGTWYDRQCDLILKATDKMRAYVGGATATDDLTANIMGYQMDAP